MPVPGQQPPQGGQPQPPQDQSAAGGSDVGRVIVETDRALSALAQSAPPEFADRLGEISQAFRAVVDDMMGAMEGGGGPQKAGPRPARGMASPEQGGNPNARPMEY